MWLWDREVDRGVRFFFFFGAGFGFVKRGEGMSRGVMLEEWERNEKGEWKEMNLPLLIVNLDF